MVKPLYYCLFLPVTLLAALCTDTRLNFKFVCIGNSIEVFQNVTRTFLKSEYTLYKMFGNEIKPETIATWVMQNFSTKAIIHPKYSQKVSLENGSILLRDFQASDEATYRMLYQDLSKNKEIQLCALVPPTLRCKPNIQHEENFLIASLDNHEFCGKPLVSVRWMEYPGISYISKSRIELPPGNDAGTYRACIEGEALNCVKNSSLPDNCENYTIATVPTISDILQWKTDTIVHVTIVSLVLLLVLLLGVIALLIKQFWKQCGIGSKNQTVNGGQATNSQTRRQEDVADPDARDQDQETIPLQQIPSAQRNES